MALRNNMALVNDGGGNRTVKPIGYDVARAGAAAVSEVNKPGRGAVDAAIKGGALASAKANLAGVSPTISSTVTDTSERDAYLAALKDQLDAQTAAYDQLLAYNQQMYDA